MKDLSTVGYFKPAEELAQILCQKTQNREPLFFRVLVAYYMTKVASMMRAHIISHDRGEIPVSMYAINLASSGHGKGHSTNIIEEQVISEFREEFLEKTFPQVAEKSLLALAQKRSIRKDTDEELELGLVKGEFENLGNLAFSFDSGTTPAVKQMRHKLLMAGAGSMNMEIDEIGSNLLGNMEVLNTFLELFDVGKVKQKLIKNTNESRRSEEIDGRTPTNMMLFGTPSKLFNGGKEEEEMTTMLETGYARRCIFGYTRATNRDKGMTAEQVYDLLTNTKSSTSLQALSGKLKALADPSNFNQPIQMTRDVSIELIKYRLECERIADEMPEHEEIKKAEISHRYFKAMKLAGTYAFIDSSTHISLDHLYNAIKLVEESGEAFMSIMTRDRHYVRLAKYIANVGREVTHVDILEDLPFYKGSAQFKQELMNYAIAYGYQNNIIIQKHTVDGIEFLKGESLQDTDLGKLVVAYSNDQTQNYRSQTVPFKQLHKLVETPGYHFVNHELEDGYRDDAHCVPGFNMLVLDVDHGLALDTARLLLKEYTYLLYTTKRHTLQENRFRIIMPISHLVKLEAVEYKQFMDNVFDFLPFEVDRQTSQRSRKWLTHKTKAEYNEGKLLDALLFIPKTSKAEKHKQVISDQQSLSNIERWFVNNTDSGNRSNQVIRYALMLVDSGKTLAEVKHAVMEMNRKLPNKLPKAEIDNTIMVTATKKIQERDTQTP